MPRLGILGPALLVALALAAPASAHSAPFTYLDLRIEAASIELTLVAHTFDVGHDVNVDPPDRVLEEAVLRAKGPEFVALMAERLRLAADGQALEIGSWSTAEALPDRQSIQVRARASLPSTPAVIRVTARLFPYDPAHQTFVNFYERDEITVQTILDVSRAEFTYYTGTARGIWSVVRTLAGAGLTHILAGPDHLLMLLGLLLIGTTRKTMMVIATAFTIGHVLSVGLGVLNVANPPSRLVEPAIALSIVYVGVDNLMVHGGRDIRAWISFAFGVIHGFGFVTVLRAMDLPRSALFWSIAAFNIGVEVGQVVAAVIIAAAIMALRSRSEDAGNRLAFAGSLVVIVAGTLWFFQRVFFPGAIA
jgi:hydrogenase/urease accessory protein HupE